MNKITKLAILLCGVAVTAPAFAGTTLSAQECTSYPFVKTTHSLTRSQINTELKELESVGYQPGLSDNNYPHLLNKAEAKLQAAYNRDCMHDAPST
ncbi:DUF4148 domain-containing protein [Paraburkholderia sp. J8-2]|uniref:DUF4148 domain-containing protein n=1 Tax=Paraburkholderia sp. J8-2 TaxID=2805440 RepID=UPI002AB736CA|nr:DUF4148 domain-containing protein [Paraburkholderia sp. J8-2]